MVRRSDASLRSFERHFAKERAEIAVNMFIYTLMVRWDQFIDEGLDAHTILLRMRINPASMDTWPRAMTYIDRCIRDGQCPDPRSLTTTLAPWTVRPR